MVDWSRFDPRVRDNWRMSGGWRDWVILLLAVVLIFSVVNMNSECRDVVGHLQDNPCYYCSQDYFVRNVSGGFYFVNDSYAVDWGFFPEEEG